MASVSYYFDEMMHRRVADQLIAKGLTIVMANDVGMTEKDDLSDHLPYAAEHGLILITFDRKFAGLAAALTNHAGVVCITKISQGDIGGIVRILAQFADEHTAEDAAGHVFWLK